MREITCTLIADGSSDIVLLPILRWLFHQHSDHPARFEWADLRTRVEPPSTLDQRIVVALMLRPCEVLFIHRDAERESYGARKQEIERAVESARRQTSLPNWIGVIPVRMQEAWLLWDETAIRQAVGNPNGKTRLDLPAINRLERIEDPKAQLHDLLRQASERSPRRLKDFNPAKQAHRIVEMIDDFAPLRQLAAFERLEHDLAALLQTLTDAHPQTETEHGN
ncbi:MAG: DUF4276 family protein [Chloroflexota bacterium]|nr:DUF4276 family protein [Chloroflexota bacterium]